MQWFVHQDDNIYGPLNSEQVLSQLKSGQLSYSSYIWGPGQVEWNSISNWEDHFKAHLDEFEVKSKQWKLRLSRSEIIENLNFEDILSKLKNIKRLQNVSVCQQNESHWKPIYSSYLFMEALGLSRRNCLRAPLMGLAKISRVEKGRFSYLVKTSTIGPGGLGVYGLGSNFTAGMPVEIKLESPDLGTQISLNGVIKYHTSQGFVGIAFDKVDNQTKSIIENYVKRFEVPSALIIDKAS